MVCPPTTPIKCETPTAAVASISSGSELINEKASLNKILEAYGINKQEITTFQANFTPEEEVDKLIEESGICKDNRPNLKVLEPTAGIGNIISGLLKCPNVSNFMIDANEYHKVFYNLLQEHLI